MIATERLYRTADDRIVGEGHPDAAFLYAAVGAEIPAGVVVDAPLPQGAPRELHPNTSGNGRIVFGVLGDLLPDGVVEIMLDDDDTANANVESDEDVVVDADKAAGDAVKQVDEPLEDKAVAPAPNKSRRARS